MLGESAVLHVGGAFGKKDDNPDDATNLPPLFISASLVHRSLRSPAWDDMLLRVNRPGDAFHRRPQPDFADSNAVSVFFAA